MISIKELEFAMLALYFSIFANGQSLSTEAQHNKENIPVNIRQEHKWWNLLHYAIAITPDTLSVVILQPNLALLMVW